VASELLFYMAVKTGKAATTQNRTRQKTAVNFVQSYLVPILFVQQNKGTGLIVHQGDREKGTR
jgi:hypothetical protein